VQIHRLGDDALLVELPDTPTATALYRWARERGVVARDIVPAARTVLFDAPDDPGALVRDLPTWWSEVTEHAAGTTERATRTVEVPTYYDGPDLDDVAARWGMTPDEVVRTHTSISFEVAFCGFSPGFAYCTGLPEDLHLPRHESPRPRVPAGAVGLAGGFTGVYPTASPGGWRLLGRTDLPLWVAHRDEPATLPPGTTVRFVAV
jgi:KipI family sensor histidine kinase inhibitor